MVWPVAPYPRPKRHSAEDAQPKHTPDALLEYSEQQLKHLTELEGQFLDFKGPCVHCRWRNFNDECTNPTVVTGRMDTRTGKVKWLYPDTHQVRGTESFQRRDRTIYPVCGPNGALWEPKTYAQLTRTAIMWMGAMQVAVWFLYLLSTVD